MTLLTQLFDIVSDEAARQRGRIAAAARKQFPIAVEQQLPLPLFDPSDKRADMADPGPATATIQLE